MSAVIPYSFRMEEDEMLNSINAIVSFKLNLFLHIYLQIIDAF